MFAEYYGMELPNEFEWEKAARSNSGYDYPFGNDITLQNANYINETDGIPFPKGSFDGSLLNIDLMGYGPENSVYLNNEDGSMWFNNITDYVVSELNEYDEDWNILFENAPPFPENYNFEGTIIGEACPGIAAHSESGYSGIRLWSCQHVPFDLTIPILYIICDDCSLVANNMYCDDEMGHGSCPITVISYPEGLIINYDIQTIDSYSPFMAYDMAGNVSEWVSHDLLDDNLRKVKGGHYHSESENLKSWKYELFNPLQSSKIIGFRCIRRLSNN
jgi:hypothetical protein